MGEMEILLADYRAFLSGDLLSADQNANADRVSLAAAFGAAAYEAGMTREHGTHALIVAVLTALVDSLDPSLDYLRAHPAAGAVARASRETTPAPASGSASK